MLWRIAVPIVLVAGILFCVLFLRSEAGIPRKQIRFSMYKYEFYDVFRRQAGKDFEAQWNAEHPDDPIEVIYEPIGGDYDAKIKTQLVGGTCPDVFIVPTTDHSRFMSDGILLDLQPYVDRFGDGPALQEIYPALIEKHTSGNSLYGLPNNFNTNVIYYNKTLFAKEGIPEPDETWDWNTLLEAALKLTKKDSAGRVLQRGLIVNVEWMDFVVANKGAFWTPDFQKAILNNPAAQEAFQFYVDLSAKYGVAPTPREKELEGGGGAQPFFNGRAAMMMGGRWWTAPLRKYSDIDWSVAPMPASFAGRRCSTIICNSMGVYAKTRHPEAAYKFLLFLSSQEQIAKLVQVGDSIPIRWADRYNQDLLAESPANRAYLLMTKDLFDTVEYFPPDIPQKELIVLYRQYYEKCYMKEMSPAEALARMESAMNAYAARERTPPRPVHLAGFSLEFLLIVGIPLLVYRILRRRRIGNHE